MLGGGATCARHQLQQCALSEPLPPCAAHRPLSATVRRPALDVHARDSGSGKRRPDMRPPAPRGTSLYCHSCAPARPLGNRTGAIKGRGARQRAHHGASRDESPSGCVHARARRTHVLGAAGHRSALSSQLRASSATPRPGHASCADAPSHPRRRPVGRARRRWARRTTKGTTGVAPARRGALAPKRRDLKVGARVAVMLFGHHTKDELS